MGRYLLRRLLSGVFTLWGITLITFFVIQLAPGDPAKVQVSGLQDSKISQEAYENLRRYYGLDKPVYVQYGLWIKNLVTLDLGPSMSPGGGRVIDRLAPVLWPTMSVSLLSIFLAFIISVPIGILSAVRQGRPFDRIVSTLLYILYSVPSYVLGMLLILYVSVKWDLLPFRGMHSDGYAQMGTWERMLDTGKHYILITICYTAGGLAFYSRFVRQNLLEVIRQDYIRTARAKGLRERHVILRHAFVNSLIPLVTLLGMTFPALLSGSVILETMFNWPGMGRLFFTSVLMRDYTTLMALNFFSACLVLLGTLAADLTYGLIDPRVSYE